MKYRLGEKWIFYSSIHMNPQGCRRPVVRIWNRKFATISKNPHLIRTLIKSRKKRNEFFIVASTLVATRWLLMLGNFETLGLKFSNETRFSEAACVLCYYTGSLHPKRTLIHFRKNGERLPKVASIIVAETRLLWLGNFETKARNLAMRQLRWLLAS